MQATFINCEILSERPKAVLMQQHSGGEYKTRWMPISCITKRLRDGVMVADWFLKANNLWAWTK